jgi:hypothetical protein
MTLLHHTGAEFRRPGANGFEPLDPVVISPRANELLSIYPELESLHHLPVDLFDDPILTDENLKTNGISREERRCQAPDEYLHRAAKVVYLSAAHLIAAHEPKDRPQAFQELVSEWEESRQVKAGDYPYARITVNHIRPVEAGDYITGVNAYNQTFQQRIIEAIRDSSSSQYDLLKMVVSVQSQSSLEDLSNGCESADFQALRWLTLMALMRSNGSQAPIADLLARGLDSGAYDRYIAYDLLNYSQPLNQERDAPGPIAAVKSLLSLVEHSAGQAADGQMISRLADGMSLGIWPRESQAAVFKERKQMLETLKYLFDTVSEFTAGVIAVDGREYKKFMYKELDELADIKQRDVMAAVKSIGQTAASHISQKRRQQPQPEQIEESAAETEDSAEREPLALMCVDSQGCLHDNTSKEFTDMIGDYLDKHKNTPNLPEDVDRMLDYLSRLDFSNGGVPGLIRISDGYAPVVLNGDGAKSLPVWEFKPKEAQGLSLKSNAATRTRIFLSVVPGANALAIRDIGRRTDSNARTLNKRSGRRRRKH